MTPEYWNQLKVRVDRHFQKVVERGHSVSKGLAIPADGDLPIGEGRRLWMAVLFLDICNFSSRPNNSAEEQAATTKAFTIFFAEMIRVIEDYEGTVEKNTGDGLMAYFENAGYTTTGATRAVSAAMTMMAINRDIIAPRLSAEDLAPINFRIGIDVGNVTIAEVGAARGFHGIVAIGTTANVASKILDVADAGQVVIGDWVKGELPKEWHTHVKEHTPQTGFTQGPNQQPYPFHLFDAHWTNTDRL